MAAAAPVFVKEKQLEEILQIGVITRPHGIHGEVKVFPMTDDVRRFKKLKKTLLDTGGGYIELECEGAKFLKQFVILKFKDHDSVESVAKYVQKGLFVTRADAVKPGKDEYFIADLIGMRVTDEEASLAGEIKNVIETGANDVYEIELDDSRMLLLPAIKECVRDVDVEGGLMKIHILPGLLDE